MCHPMQIAPQSAQQIVMQAVEKPECGGEQELTALQRQRLFHLTKQAAQEAACLLWLLIGQRINRTVYRHLTAVNGKCL